MNSSGEGPGPEGPPNTLHRLRLPVLPIHCPPPPSSVLALGISQSERGMEPCLDSECRVSSQRGWSQRGSGSGEGHILGLQPSSLQG